MIKPGDVVTVFLNDVHCYAVVWHLPGKFGKEYAYVEWLFINGCRHINYWPVVELTSICSVYDHVEAIRNGDYTSLEQVIAEFEDD